MGSIIRHAADVAARGLEALMENVAADSVGEAPSRDRSADTKQGLGGVSTRELVRDVRRLATYAVETGRLPDEVDMADIYRAEIRLAQGEELASEEFTRIVGYYQKLEHGFPNITTHTLAATEPEIPGRIRTSPAGRYLIRLWAGTIVVVAAIILANLVPQLVSGDSLVYQAMNHLEPFLYGAFGAFAFILRVTEKRLWTREFVPARAPEHINRLVLGTLAGGAIILFFAEIPDSGNSVQIGGAALGFIAGYSVDFLFQTIERVIGALLPKVGLESLEHRSQRRRDEELIRRYEALAQETDDENVRKIMRRLAEEIRHR
jgi:hypothetical protein